MNVEEATTVLCAISHADGGCLHCVKAVVERLVCDIPDVAWTEAAKMSDADERTSIGCQGDMQRVVSGICEKIAPRVITRVMDDGIETKDGAA